jgi:predicted nucleotide-binding protein
MVKNNESKEYEERILKQVRDLDHRLDTAINENNTALIASYGIELELLLGKASILWKNTATILAHFRAMSQVYLRQDKHSLLLFLKDCTHRLLMTIDDKEKPDIGAIKGEIKMTVDNTNDLKPGIKRLFITIAETVIIEENNEFLANVDGLRLKALIREQDEDKMSGYLAELQEKGYLIKWSRVGDIVNIIMSRKISMPDVETSKRESIEDDVMNRAILFKLFEEARKKDFLVAAQVAISPLSTILRPKVIKIAANATYLKSIGLIETPYMDGGDFISYLTPSGMELAKNTDILFSKYSMVKIETKEHKEVKETNKPDPRKVFVVYGRNEEARKAMFDFLRSIDLAPMEWSEAVKLTGEGSPYNGQIVEGALSIAQAIVVLITGDDLARIGTRFIPTGKPAEELKAQARPNVLFEAGMAFGVNSTRTILVELGATREISDLAGRNTIRIDNTPKKRQELAMRLKTAGCAAHFDDRTDWHDSGDFDKANLPADKP